MSADPRRLIQGALDLARSKGAVAAEVLIDEVEHRTCTGRKEALRPPKTSRTLHIHVYLEGGATGASSGHFDENVEPVLRRAMTAAGNAAADPLAGPADRMDLASQGLQIADIRQSRLADGDRRDIIAHNEDGLRAAVRGGGVGTFTYDERVTRRAIGTTRGVEGQETATRFTLRGELKLASGVVVSGQVQSRRFADVASMPLGADLLKRGALLGTTLPMPERRLPIVFEPFALAQLLPVLVGAFDAGLVSAGKSWLAHLPGDLPTVGSSRLYLVDDAAQPGALETRAFDDRGVPPMPVPLIREGRLGALYLDPREARRRGARPTGTHRADGSLWSGNLMIRPGNRSRNMMFPDVGRYLLVEQLYDTNGVNNKTGNLRLPVRLALAEQGKVLGLIGDYQLTGTILELLSSITEMASDTERHGATDACTWVVEGLKIEG